MKAVGRCYKILKRRKETRKTYGDDVNDGRLSNDPRRRFTEGRQFDRRRSISLGDDNEAESLPKVQEDPTLDYAIHYAINNAYPSDGLAKDEKELQP